MSTVAMEVLAATGALLLSTSLAAALAAVASSAALASRLIAREQSIERTLRFLRAPITGRAWVRVELGAFGFSTGLLLLRGDLAWLVLVAAAIPVAWSVVLRLRDLRIDALEAQLDRFLLSIAHSLRANPALADALASSARMLTSPLKDEIELALREHALGTPLDRALSAMAARVDSPVTTSALATLRVARATGGDLSKTLEASAAALREMARLEGVVRTKTAEARAQAVVIAIIPFPMFASLHALDPRFLRPVLETSIGHVVLAIAGLAWLAAILAARRIAQVDI